MTLSTRDLTAARKTRSLAENDRKTLVLPWPDSRLSPNNRARHRYLTGVRTIARNTGYCAALAAGLQIPDRTPLHMYLTFNPPNYRRRDIDNLLSSSKAALDGIFQALGVDDSNVRITTLEMGKPVKGGQVVCRIETIKPERTK
jgi:crossover junction endodeoxyribonuclease RusA